MPKHGRKLKIEGSCSWNPIAICRGAHQVVTLVTLQFSKLNRGSLGKVVTIFLIPPRGIAKKRPEGIAFFDELVVAI